MGDSLITIIAIMLASILMFVFPMMSMAERNDDVSLSTVQSAVVEFVDNARTTGKITNESYDTLTQKIYATGNTYDINMEIQLLDENPGKKATNVAQDKVGENLYYSKYTTQILDELKDENNNGVITLKEGDFISVNATNTNTTISQMLKNFFYNLSDNNTYNIVAQHSGVVMVDGSSN